MIRGEPSLAHEGALRRVTPEDGVFQDDAIAFALPVLDNDDDYHHHCQELARQTQWHRLGRHHLRV